MNFHLNLNQNVNLNLNMNLNMNFEYKAMVPRDTHLPFAVWRVHRDTSRCRIPTEIVCGWRAD